MTEPLKHLQSSIIRKIRSFYLLFLIISLGFILLSLNGVSLEKILIICLVYVSLSLVVLMLYIGFFKKYIIREMGSSLLLFKSSKTAINNISHEIRTPLNGIMGFTENLLELEEDKTKRESLLVIKENSERLFSTANKLIDLSHLSSGQFEVVREYISNSSLIIDLESKYTSEIQKKGLLLTIDNQIPESRKLFTDKKALFEILDMLMENAVKYTEEGTVSLKSTYDRGVLVYEVCDTGMGISEEKKEVIFRLFSQGRSALNRDFEGLGLGLTISRKLAELLGGSLHLINPGGKGACFRLEIKTESQVSEYESDDIDVTDLVKILDRSKREEMLGVLGKLSQNLRVFNPVSIRSLSEELATIHICLRKIAGRLKATADTYDEQEFSKLVKDMLKGINNENFE